MNLHLQILSAEGNRDRDLQIKKEIIQCYASKQLLGKFRIQPIPNQGIIHVVLVLPHLKRLPFLEIHYPENPLSQSLNIRIHTYNNQSVLQSTVYTPKLQNIKLKDIIHQAYQEIQNTTQKNSKHILSSVDISQATIKNMVVSTETLKMKDQLCESSSLQKQIQEKVKTQRKRKLKRQVSMASNVEKELTQTKNLNRHFRSKLRQVYKDLMATQKVCQDSLYIEQVFSPNRVGFEDIRKALKNDWFNKAVKRQMNTGRFLHKILRGIMGVKSKKLMIKYYHVMASAVQNPDGFIRWKYQ